MSPAALVTADTVSGAKSRLAFAGPLSPAMKTTLSAYMMFDRQKGTGDGSTADILLARPSVDPEDLDDDFGRMPLPGGDEQRSREPLQIRRRRFERRCRP